MEKAHSVEVRMGNGRPDYPSGQRRLVFILFCNKRQKHWNQKVHNKLSFSRKITFLLAILNPCFSYHFMVLSLEISSVVLVSTPRKIRGAVAIITRKPLLEWVDNFAEVNSLDKQVLW